MNTEKWKGIEGWEDQYAVSDLGKVKAIPRFVGSGNGSYWRDEIILKPLVNDKGYLVVNLNRNNTRITKPSRIHRLVALAFIENPLQKPTVNHEDGDKTNNKVSNLTWATYQEQADHVRIVLGKKVGRKKKIAL